VIDCLDARGPPHAVFPADQRHVLDLLVGVSLVDRTYTRLWVVTYVVAVVRPGNGVSRADVDIRWEVFYLDRCVTKSPEEGREGDAGRDVEESHRGVVRSIDGRAWYPGLSGSSVRWLEGLNSVDGLSNGHIYRSTCSYVAQFCCLTRIDLSVYTSLNVLL